MFEWKKAGDGSFEDSTGRFQLQKMPVNDGDTKAMFNAYDNVDERVHPINAVRLTLAEAKEFVESYAALHPVEVKEIQVNPKRLYWKAPTELDFEGGTATFQVWESECGRYKLARASGPNARFMATHIAEGREIFITNDRRSLHAVMDSVEKHLREQLGGGVHLETNKVEVLASASSVGLDRLSPVVETISNPAFINVQVKEKSTMLLQEKEARQVLSAVGYKSSDSCPLDKVKARINALVSNLSNLATPEDPNQNQVFKKCLDALREGMEIQLVVESPSTSTVAKTSSARRPAQPRTNSTAVKGKKPGVGATIIELLTGASRAEPISKDKIMQVLTKRFPERQEKSMRSTLDTHIGGDIAAKGLAVHKNENGYWIRGKVS